MRPKKSVAVYATGAIVSGAALGAAAGLLEKSLDLKSFDPRDWAKARAQQEMLVSQNHQGAERLRKVTMAVLNEADQYDHRLGYLSARDYATLADTLGIGGYLRELSVEERGTLPPVIIGTFSGDPAMLGTVNAQAGYLIIPLDLTDKVLKLARDHHLDSQSQ